MKTLYILCIGLLVSGSVMAQSCLPDGIIFTTQAQIDNFQINYPNCTEIEGYVEINGYDITNLNGLNVLTTIGEGLYIDGDNSLTSLTGLEGLTTIEALWISNYNASLTSLTGLENLTSIGEYFAIVYNAALNSLTGLDNLTSIGGDLWFEGNDALTSLTGLENLTSIGGDLAIGSNTSLTSLTGLDNLTSIGGRFGINDNASLASLANLDSIDAGSITYLEICYNEALSTCEVQSVCDYLANPNGPIEIHDNATACNSQAEVEEACTAGLDDNNQHFNQFNIYPNPSSTQITIELPNIPPKNTLLTIYNLNGQQLLTQPITEPQTVVDISGLPRGVYFVKVVDEEKVMMGKVVKE